MTTCTRKLASSAPNSKKWPAMQCNTNLLVLVLASLAALACTGVAHANDEYMDVKAEQVSLAEVCANRVVPLFRVSDVRKLLRELHKDPKACPRAYRAAFYELEPILGAAAQGHERVCSEQKFKLIRDYHFRYINPRVETYELGDNLESLDKVVKPRALTADKVDETVQLDEYNQEILIPIALQQFFKAWAMQVSGLCKISVVDNLKRAIETNLDDVDVNLLNDYVKLDAKAVHPITREPLNIAPKGQIDLQSLVRMPELDGRADSRADGNVAVLDLANSEPQLDRFMRSCKARYAPIYSRLTLPIVRMAKLGYDYMGPHADEFQQQVETDPQVRRWLVLTRICETMGNTQLVGEPSPSEPPIETVHYEPVIMRQPDDQLWIKGAEALQDEFERASGAKSTGFKRFMYKMGVHGRKAVAALDPHQFAWYRRNQNTLSSVLNTVSIGSNAASMALTIGRRR